MKKDTKSFIITIISLTLIVIGLILIIDKMVLLQTIAQYLNIIVIAIVGYYAYQVANKQGSIDQKLINAQEKGKIVNRILSPVKNDLRALEASNPYIILENNLQWQKWYEITENSEYAYLLGQLDKEIKEKIRYFDDELKNIQKEFQNDKSNILEIFSNSINEKLNPPVKMTKENVINSAFFYTINNIPCRINFLDLLILDKNIDKALPPDYSDGKFILGNQTQSNDKTINDFNAVFQDIEEKTKAYKAYSKFFNRAKNVWLEIPFLRKLIENEIDA